MPTSGESHDRRVDVLRRVWAASTLALVAVTWRLWTPQTAFPQVPLVRIGGALPAFAQWLATAGLAGTLVVLAVGPGAPRVWRPALAAFVALLGLLVFADTARLQAWAYQGLLWSLVLVLAPPALARRLLVWLVASIYAWSAVSKLDYEFVHTLGATLVAALARGAGVDVARAPPLVAELGPWLLPLAELVAAAALLWPRLGRWRLLVPVLMHVLLVAALGPMGLGHQPGVLVWNAGFLAQVVVLCGDRRRVSVPADRAAAAVARADAERPASHTVGARIACGLTVVAVLLPLGAGGGWCDHWLAWGLYAPSAERVVVLVDRAEAERLPEHVRQHFSSPGDEERWRLLRIDAWSLAALGVPIYPAARVQLGVAAAVAERWGLNRQVRVVVYGRADRWTGKRDERILTGLAEFAAAGQEFWLNWRPAPRFVAQ